MTGGLDAGRARLGAPLLHLAILTAAYGLIARLALRRFASRLACSPTEIVRRDLSRHAHAPPAPHQALRDLVRETDLSPAH